MIICSTCSLLLLGQNGYQTLLKFWFCLTVCYLLVNFLGKYTIKTIPVHVLMVAAHVCVYDVIVLFFINFR